MRAHDMTHEGEGLTFSQNVSSLALPVLELRHFEDSEEKGHWLNELMTKVLINTPKNALSSDEGIYSKNLIQELKLYCVIYN